MKDNLKDYRQKALNGFQTFENIITIVLSVIIGAMIVMSLFRVVQQFYLLFFYDFIEPSEVSFRDYQDLFGKIMTLLISLEFMNSILKVLKYHEVKVLILDVSLITALAITRKLIIYDYEHHEPAETIVLGGLIISIGVFYFLINYSKKSNSDSTSKES